MEYRVLARKYRPANFDDLIGQETLVQTLSNAIRTGRIAHAFLLTGIRGIGKTTTARIIARALNCVGVDGQGSATISPCGVCPNCKMIADDRHVDVLEMDAASHTGVNDVREIIETVRYLPTSARYKIYIIDEVHMLSNSAFNALLKTLEEPPPHVKFVFATTEVRKIPVTILSRCQRFDLKRISTEQLAAHLGNIATKESVEADPEALTLLSVAAEGSVRDGLSLLDQAIARNLGDKGVARITLSSVRQMMGSADKTATFRLLETLLSGDTPAALDDLRGQYAAGTDPILLLQDCLEAVHLVTRVKVSPQALNDISLSEHDRAAAQSMASRLSMPVLTRLWQMLLKGLGELRMAPAPLAAFEMLIVRVAYAAQLPTPAEVIRQAGTDVAKPQAAAPSLVKPAAAVPASAEGAELKKNRIALPDFRSVVALFEQKREGLKHTYLMRQAHLVAFEQGCITLRLQEGVPRSAIAEMAQSLSEWAGEPWKIILSSEGGDPTLHEQTEARKTQKIEEAAAHPLVGSVMEQFPGAKLVKVTA